GSKVRSLDLISAQLSDNEGHTGRIWDPFTGSSVVAQRLAADGHHMWATDALDSSAMFATAMLGVNRAPSGDGLLQAAADVSAPHLDAGVWSKWVQREDEAIASRDGSALLSVGADVPQRWRSEVADQSIRNLFFDVEAAATSAEVQHEGLISSTYAGTYFGIRQALGLEQLRSRIDAVAPAEDLSSSWVRASLLTALCSAASTAVFSAGKHFAQPHRVRPGKSLAFHMKRALTDRSVDVVEQFRRAVHEIGARAAAGAEGHASGRRLVEQANADDLISRGVTAVYADPPSTAQQYS